MNQPPATLITYAITGIIIAIVFAVRWRRMRRETLLRLERLWMLPAFYAALVAFVLAERPPSGAGWFYCAVALAIGAALGWQRGRMMTIRVDPDSHALRQTSSPAAMLFILAIVLLRQGARGGAGWPCSVLAFPFVPCLFYLAVAFIAISLSLLCELR